MFGQSVSAAFDPLEEVCKSGNISFNNQSVNGTSYRWDFCLEDFEDLPSITESLGTISGSSSPEGIELVYWLDNWYGFVSSRDNGNLYRLDYGSDLSSTPTVSEVVVSGSVIPNAKDIRLVFEEGNWYGLLSSTSSNRLYRLSFGSSLVNGALAEDLGVLGIWNSLRGIDLAVSGSDVIVMVSGFGSRSLTLVRFPGGIVNDPDPEADILEVSDVSLVSGPMGISLLETEIGWYGLVASFSNNKLLKLSFGTELFSDPEVSEVITGSSLSSPTSVSLQREGFNYYGLVMGRNNGLRAIDFGNTLSGGSILEELIIGTLGELSNVFAFKVEKDGFDWSGLAVSATSKVSYLSFSEVSCDYVSEASSIQFEPTNISYESAGTYPIELTAYHPNGNSEVYLGSVTVTDDQAPDISFSTDNSCISTLSQFTSINTTGDITSYSWDFDGDGTEDSTDANPSYQYQNTGSYAAKLTVANGSCTNTYIDTVKIYNAPEADFTLPAGNLCTQTPISFTNNSVYDQGSPVTFSWDFDGDGIEDSNEASPIYIYSTSGNYNVRLIVDLPQSCKDTLTQQAVIGEGFDIDFTWANNCFGEEIQFTNLAVDDAGYSYSWDFGDEVGVSSVRNPTYAYSTPGLHLVELIVDNGTCAIPFLRTVVVNADPLVSAEIGNGVQNVPTRFTGIDLTLSGDSIVSWSWDFGGLGSSTDQEATFVFTTLGSYNIELTASTAQGCTDSYTELLVVEEAQTAFPSFMSSSPVCQGERLSFNNQSVNGTSYRWDFCLEDFEDLPSITESIGTIPGSSNPEGIELVYWLDNWYGFVSSRDNGKLYRLDYGSDLRTEPIVSEVLITGSTISNVKDVRLLFEEGNWYGILSSTSSNRLYRLNFGSSLVNGAVAEDLGVLGTWNSLRGIDLAVSGSDVIVMVSGFGSKSLTLVRFPGGVVNDPDPEEDVLEVSDVSLVSGPMGISMLETEEGWYGLVASFSNNKLLKLSFGTDLFSDPEVSEVITGSSLSSPTSVSLQREGFNYYGLVMGRNNGLRAIDFGNTLTGTSITEELSIGTLGELSNVFAFRLKKDGSDWKGLSVSATSKVSYLSFSEVSCDYVSEASSIQFKPTNISYESAGTYPIELTAYHPNGNSASYTGIVTVTDDQAPDISFSTDNSCIAAINQFTSINTTGDITSYSWDLDGDGVEDSTDPNPSYQYQNTGSYAAKVTVTNGSCTNTYIDTVRIYNAPEADFTLPAGNLCTQTPISFTNNSVYDQGSPVSFSWDFDGDGIEDSAEASPSYIYSTSGTYDVRLIVNLPQSCADTLTQQAIIGEGFDIDFTWANNCFGEEIQFTNLAVDDAGYSYSWDFGDGVGVSSVRNPTYAYSTAGTYLVELVVDNGTCAIPFSRTVVVNADPLVGAEIGSGVQNVPTRFTGIDLTLSGDSIVSWSWDFGGLGSSTDQEASFIFNTLGSYNIGLTATTAQGCTDSYAELLVVEEAQTAFPSFMSSSPVCQGERLSFNNQSVNGTSYRWDFCLEDFEDLPSITESLGNISGSSSPEGIELVYWLDNWYGFVSSRDNGKLYRLDYGSDLRTEPIVSEVLITGSTISNVKDVRLLYEEGNWYGILSSTSSNRLDRLSFGSSLVNGAVAEDLGVLGSWNSLRGIDLAVAGSDVIVLVSGFSSGSLTLVRFQGGIVNDPDPTADILEVSDVDLVSGPMGISLLETETGWYGLVASFSNNKLLKLTFGTDLFSDPEVSEVITGSSFSSPTSVSLQREGFNYYGLVMGRNNGLRTIDFGNTLSGESILEELIIGTLGELSNVFAFKVEKDGFDWSGLAVSATSKVSLISFSTGSCAYISSSTSSEYEPIGISYDSSGTFPIELTAYHPNGNSASYTNTVTVTDDQAPDISFSTYNSCIAAINEFTSINTTGDITSYSWDFDGDGVEDSTDPNPSYQYQNTGSYAAKVTVTNGSCTNTYIDTVRIYNAPEADFTLPAGNLCTQTPISFTNNSVYDQGSPVSFSWDFDGDGIEDSAEASPSYIYSTSGTYDVRLIVNLPQSCADTLMKNVLVNEGYAVEFAWENLCFGEEIQFTNLSLDDAGYGYSWDFGDELGTSTDRNPTYAYSEAGSYTVALTIDNGTCAIPFSRGVVVNADPLVSAAIGAGVQNVPISFRGIDQTLSGDSIVSWSWDFGGLGSSTDQEAHFIFNTLGSYNIGLTATTAQGCTDSYTELLVVEEAQTAFPSFMSSSPVCQGERLSFNNQSVNGTSYGWDFCLNGFSELPVFSESLESISGANNPEGIELVYWLDNWYGFVSSRDNGNLYRLDYGSDLSSTPIVSEVVVSGAVNPNAKDIRLVFEEGNWYGVLSSTSSNRLYRLSFGSSLVNGAVAEDLGVLGSWNSLRGIDLAVSGSDVIVMVSGFGSKSLTLVRFPGGIVNDPDPEEDVLEVSDVSLVSGPMGISLIETEEGWYGLVASFSNNKLLKLSFGGQLFSDPEVSEVITGSSLSSPTSVSLQREGFNYYGLVMGRNSGLRSIDFGNTLTGTSISEELSIGTLGELSNVFAFRLKKDGSDWKGLSVSATSKVSYLSFSEVSCDYVSEASSIQFEPSNISYESAGTYPIELTAYHPNGNSEVYLGSVTVTDDQAPDISFSTDNSCISTLSQFTSINTSGDITSYSWDLDGDGVEDSTDPNPSYQYENIRGYNVTVSVEASTGCENFLVDEVTIYPEPPEPLITFGKSTYCQFEEISITNSTIDAGYDDVLEYHWITPNQDTLVGKVPEFSFATPGQKILTVYTTIPGCQSASIRRSLLVSASPTMAFSVTPTCFGETTVFTNTSQGASFLWDFGDGFTGTQTSMSHVYSAPGTYFVKLQATNPNGCINMLEKEILVGAIPNAGFNYNIVCEDFESKLTDVSVVEGADIISWNWIKDGETFSNERNPSVFLENPGDETISLTVSASNGCSSSYTEAINVLANADIELDVSVACFGDSSVISEVNLGESNISNRIWSVNDEVLSFSGSSFKYLFSEPGTYQISLMVDTENLCSAEITELVEVRAKPELAIELQASCENELNTLIDNSTSPFDPIVSRSWYLEDTFIGNGKQVLLSGIQAGAYQAMLLATTMNGCLISDSLDINVLSYPQVDFIVSNNYDTPPFSSQFANRTTNASSYNWYVNDVLVNSDRDFEYTFSDFGLYQIKLVALNENGCTDSLTKVVTAVVPRVDMSISNLEFNGSTNPQQITFDINNSGNLPVEIFQVRLEFQNDYQITETVFQKIDFGASAIVTLNVNVPEGTNTDYLCAQVISPFNSQDETPENNEYCLDLIGKTSFEPPYPNPTRDRTIIRTILNQAGSVKVTILDLSGQIHSTTLITDLNVGLHSFEIDLSKLDAGTYFISITHSEGVHHSRIIKK